MAEYHFVISVQKPVGAAGLAMGDWSGTVTPEPGWTRADAYRFIKAEFAQRFPDLGAACTTFFSLEPNQL